MSRGLESVRENIVWVLPPQIICAHTCYCRPYLYGLLSLFFFSLWLAFSPSKICLVLLRHILVLPIHTLVAVVIHGLGNLMDTQECMFWACHELGVNYMPKMCIKWVQSVSGHHPSFFGNKMDLTWGRNVKKRSRLFVLPAITTMCAHTMLGVSIGKLHVRQKVSAN